jgi:hypothetical protein
MAPEVLRKSPPEAWEGNPSAGWQAHKEDDAMSLHYRLVPADPAIRAFDSRQRGDLSRNLDALLKGAPSSMALGVVVERLKEMLGNPDLSEVLDAVESIYHADDADAHYSAARCLRIAARETLDDHDIE